MKELTRTAIAKAATTAEKHHCRAVVGSGFSFDGQQYKYIGLEDKIKATYTAICFNITTLEYVYFSPFLVEVMTGNRIMSESDINQARRFVDLELLEKELADKGIDVEVLSIYNRPEKIEYVVMGAPLGEEIMCRQITAMTPKEAANIFCANLWLTQDDDIHIQAVISPCSKARLSIDTKDIILKKRS